jgi:hypothetical protein
MKKIVIIIITLFLLLSVVNFGTSMPVQYNESTSDLDNIIDRLDIDKTKEQQILKNINRLDGFFTENRGQVGNDSVRYYIQGKGVWFLDNSIVFEKKESINTNEVQRDQLFRFHPEYESEIPQPRKSVVLKLNFDDCNNVEPKGIGLLPHRSNFFLGNDSSKWCTNVPNFQGIIYKNIYNKIDLRYYSSERGLKYDFIVHPEGDIEKINIRCTGGKEVLISSKSDIIIRTEVGDIIDNSLFIYQNNNEIEGKFRLLSSNLYGFELLSEYDSTQDLIIDPLLYSTFVGGSSFDGLLGGAAVAIDINGSAYVTGGTSSSDFPTTVGVIDTTHNGFHDVFIYKINPSGSTLSYSTYVGAGNSDHGNSIKVDSYGSAFVTGPTSSSGFPKTTNAYDTTHNGGQDAYLIKINSNGSSLLYSTFIGGSGDDLGNELEINSNNIVFLGGYTDSTNFPKTTNAYDTSQNGDDDGFILKLNPIGGGSSDLLYSTFFGHVNYDGCFGMDIDINGIVYVTGHTYSPNFPTTTNAYNETYNGGVDGFLLKLNPAGTGLNDLLYSTFIGGSNMDLCRDIVIDSNGNAYVTGRTESNDFPNTTGAFDQFSNGDWDTFVIKIDPSGNGQNDLIYSTYIGGTGFDEGTAITIDPKNIIYVTGQTNSNNFPITPNTYDTSFNGNYDVFIFKLDPTGSSLINSTYMGGNGPDEGWGITIDTYYNIYVGGKTESQNFPTTPTANDTTHNGNLDNFILKIGLNNYPSVMDLKISKPLVLRTNSINLYSNASDYEDHESDLTPIFEYSKPSEQIWEKEFFSKPQYQNSRWEVIFTPSINATLGIYDFRVRFNDTGMLFTNWIYLNNSLTVLNNIPMVENLYQSNETAILDDTIFLGINGSDIEDLEKNLTVHLEYKDSDDLFWNTHSTNPIYFNERWELSFIVPHDSSFGYFNFKVRFNDTDEDYSQWFYANNSLQILNLKPIVVEINLSKNPIYRTESIYVFVNATDYETPESMLDFYIQYKPKIKDEWYNLSGGYSNNRWEADFYTYSDSILGFYDFRVRFDDNEFKSSGWMYLNHSLEVLNNLPKISNDLDDISIGIQPSILDLTHYESDIEDMDSDLIWSISAQTYTYIDSVEIIDILNDTLKITPKENVSGTEDIELTLTDKDGGTAVKSGITIIVDSTISEFTPKVTLLSPVNKAVINTLTPTLKWELDYSGSDTITYTVILDENPDPQTTIIAGLTSTEYPLENELVDGKTYYWKVEPINGICLSGAFRFTIDLGFEPIYKVNLTVESKSATIKQGATKVINLTVINEGNSADNFEIEFDSAKLQTHINIDKTNILLDPEINSKVKLSIDIPDDFATGIYVISVMATSLTDLTTKDTVTIEVKVVSKDFIPSYDVSISIRPTFLELEQGDSDSISIYVTNEGNIEYYVTIRFESNDFTSDDITIQGSKLLLLKDGDNLACITITVPENMEPGVYTIKFIAENDETSDESSLTLLITEKEDGKKEEDDYTTLYALVVIVVIIIVVLILVFIFLKKKKGEKEEPPVEEAQPPPPEEVPTEVSPEHVPTPEPPLSEQPPTSEVPPEQAPVTETPSPEQPPTPEATPQVPQPQVEPAPQEPMPQVEEQPAPQPQVEPQPQGQAPVPKIKTPKENVEG